MIIPKRTGRLGRSSLAALVAAASLFHFSSQASAAPLSGAWAGSPLASTVDTVAVNAVISGVASATQTNAAGTLDVGTYANATASGASAYSVVFTPSNAGATATVTFNFAKPLRDPAFHIGGLGGFSGGNTLSSKLTFSAPFTVTAANAAFVQSGNSLIRPLLAVASSSGCVAATGNGCGSIQFAGDFSSITMVQTYGNGAFSGDGVRFAIEGLQAESDLSIAATTPTIMPGGSGTQTLTVTNNGPNFSPGPQTVSYSPPSGASITALPAGCTGPDP
jgi:hypothetical protein